MTLKQINFTNYAGFGFWARKANLIHLKNIRSDLYLRVGRGLSLHIAPSNISANALYTFAFGLLSGSPSIIRLSKKNIDELSENLINVFLPTTPNPTSGFLLMVPKKDLIYLDVSFEQASKFIVSAGTSNIS